MRILLLIIASVTLCLPSFAADKFEPQKNAAGFFEIEATSKQLTDFVLDCQRGTLAFKFKGVWLAFTPPEGKPSEASVAVSTLLSDLHRAKRIQLTYVPKDSDFDDAPWTGEDKKYNHVYRLRLFF
jgi:hypothetical protein